MPVKFKDFGIFFRWVEILNFNNSHKPTTSYIDKKALQQFEDAVENKKANAHFI